MLLSITSAKGFGILITEMQQFSFKIFYLNAVKLPAIKHKKKLTTE
jgi:hypothetical protein